MKIEIVEVTKNEDGTYNIQFDYDDEYTDFLKQEIGAENPTEEQIQNYILSVIQKVIDAKESE